jgi:lipopolysaccharide/colanic/teichoic acid biosynthesis glycosyltransferase
MKRTFDILIVLLALIPALLIGIVLAPVIRMKLGSPILFLQARRGKNGKIFKIVKFRSMSVERDSKGVLLPDDKRLTPFGKWLRKTSLDELPELWNVLKGEMSLVGPRPLIVEYMPLYTDDQNRRHEVRPGITGWAQVNGGNALDWHERFELDVWYVENHNFWLDLKILWFTLFAVVKKDGISADGHATMPKFKGSGEGD